MYSFVIGLSIDSKHNILVY